MQARMRLPAWNEARLTYLWGEESNSAYMRARDQLTLLQINCLSCNGDPSVRFTIAIHGIVNGAVQFADDAARLRDTGQSIGKGVKELGDDVATGIAQVSKNISGLLGKH